MAVARIAAPPSTAPVVGFAVVAAALSVMWPLATYTTTLALFGGAHVLSELRYVDVTFSGRLRPALRAWLAATLAAVVAVRIAGIVHLLPPGTSVPIELTLVTATTAGALPLLARLGGWRLAIGLAVTGALATGVLLAPTATLLTLAVLHNLTPVGFLADALRGDERRRVLAAAAVAFVGIPALIVTGWPRLALTSLGLVHPDAALLDVGPLSAHLGVFAHADLGALRVDVFSAAVTGQCLHYGAVIGVLPGLLPPGEARGIVCWPPHRVMLALLAGASAALFLGFAWRFGDARSWYGVAAAVHAWIELPLLLIALGGRDR